MVATILDNESKTELQRADAPFSISPITYPAQKEMIAKLADDYMALTVASVDDKKGLEAVKVAHIEVKKIIAAIEKRRTELKADALKYGREVDSAAKALTELLNPIKVHLEYERSLPERIAAKLAEEKAQQEREAAEKKLLVTRERCQQLANCGGRPYLACDVEDLSDEDFGQLLASEQADKAQRDEQAAAEKREQERIFQQQRDEQLKLAEERREFDRQKAEVEARSKRMGARVCMLGNLGFVHELTGDQLADMSPEDWEQILETARRQDSERTRAAAEEKARLERQRKEQEEAQAKIDAEHKRIADEEAERVRRAEIAKAQEEAAEQARIDAIAEQARIAKAEKDAAEAAALELRQREARRPDAEKLLAIADTVELLSRSLPPVSVGAAKAASRIEEILAEAAIDIKEVANELVGDSAA